ncbi:MAG: shikimate dehydrogenase [Gloeomargarita sp. SKYBB_i_bin120]|nr:shikimate dehydrogenase [Gloeomargarita sp. SKYG98]MCS7292857.1 shikimate dehydrogenase [Gloeomargarita sp. SKYB120]MDW8178420.1 shikimate dehydrogenase [Gloeomargarita sp. SKYBB_i_bin120]
MITSRTRLLAVVGDPVHHSLSPLMHNAALAQAQIDACYVALPVAADQLGNVLAALWHTQWLGLSVTLPHKQRVMAYLTEVTPVAQAIGAVNTLYRGASGWCGANTDGVGFVQPLADWSGETAVVLGYGGAARAVVWGLQQRGCTAIHIFSRRPDQAVAPPARLHPWSDLDTYLPQADLVVNTTPLGMAPEVTRSPLTPEQLQQLPRGAWVYDLIYTPRPTQLLRWAAALGYRTQDGLAMLVGQGAAAWKYWFQQEAPLAVMTQTLEQYLQQMSASAAAGPTRDTQG